MSLCLRLARLQFHGPLFRSLLSLSKNSSRNVSSETVPVYHGPLAQTFRNVKIFSLTSLGLATSMTPLFFIIESALPMSARVALAATALGTSSISTALVGWCGAPYVSTLRRLPDGGIEMETMTLHLRSRYTCVYDPTLFLRETRRPFAKWELVDNVEGKMGESKMEETVAETKDKHGRVLGRWVVQWRDGKGRCRGVGNIIRWVC